MGTVYQDSDKNKGLKRDRKLLSSISREQPKVSVMPAVGGVEGLDLAIPPFAKNAKDGAPGDVPQGLKSA
jgi:hypothetical protein